MKPTRNDIKAQGVRIADVLLIGPLMVWGGARAIPQHPIAGVALTLMGMGTIVLNGVNFRKIERRKNYAR